MYNRFSVRRSSLTVLFFSLFSRLIMVINRCLKIVDYVILAIR